MSKFDEKMKAFMETIEAVKSEIRMLNDEVEVYCNDIIDRQTEWEEYAEENGFEKEDLVDSAIETLDTARQYLGDFYKEIDGLYEMAYKPFGEVF